MRDVDYCGDAAAVEVFSGAAQALRRLKARGYKIFVITNQSGIGRGYFTEADYRAVEKEFLRQLGPELVEATYFCPDTPGVSSPRRKPQPGMVFEAQREHQLDLARSFFVGDKASDVECGRLAGVHTILVETGYGKLAAASSPDFIARDLGQAAEIILAAADNPAGECR